MKHLSLLSLLLHLPQIVGKGNTGAFLVIHIVQPDVRPLDLVADRDYMFNVNFNLGLPQLMYRCGV